MTRRVLRASTTQPQADIDGTQRKFAMTTLPPCFPESPIPAERAVEESWHRIIQTADDQIDWDPDRQPNARLTEEECIQLETRGITQGKIPEPKIRIPKPYQIEFWGKQTIHKNTVAAKLRLAGLEEEALTLESCHSYFTFAVCGDCHTVSKFPNRCDLFFCPECQPRLSHDRRKQVEWWTKLIKQPKHVVLTLKNIPDLQPEHIDEARRFLTNLRKRKFAKNWSGGFYSLEITNEGNGWHLHWHLLVDAKWIDSAELSLQWDNCTRGFGRIVKVKDCRDQAYLAEVTKYAVKGSQLASWTPDQISTFVRAVKGKRTFGVFGSLYGARTEFAEWIATMKQAKPKCECGSCNVQYYSEAKFLELDLSPTIPKKPEPPEATSHQLDLVKPSQTPPR